VGDKKVKIKGEVGVKQGDNLGPILFIYLIQAVSVTLNQKWEFEQPVFKPTRHRISLKTNYQAL